MFWHGNNFGQSLSDFVNIMLAKTMITGTTAIFYNFHCGFSVGNFVQDFMFLMYNFTTFGWYPILEVNINKRRYQDDESKLPFSMSEAYAYFRDRYMKGMLNRFCIFSFFIYYGGAVSYYITF